jgi:hypothetical protein
MTLKAREQWWKWWIVLEAAAVLFAVGAAIVIKVL